MKHFLKSTFGQWLIGNFIAVFIVVTRRTSRLSEHNAQAVEAYWQTDKPVIVAIWHGRLVQMPYLFRHCPHKVYALISAHRDGLLVSYAAKRFGIDTVKGSSTRGGAAALKALLRLAKSDHSLFITPDGPKGPRMQAQNGVLDVARMTGLPILPVSMSATKGKLIRSWDRFFLPRPFSHIHLVWGEAITIPRDATDAQMADYRTQVEAAMTAVQDKADTLAGRPKTEGVARS